MSFNILAVHFSQTGQLGRTLDAFLEPFKSEPFVITNVVLEPEKAFAFPWGFFPFFEAMPDTVLGAPRSIKPVRIEEGRHFDLVVIAYQPWFLSLSQPVQAFFKQHGDFLKGAPVVALTACRDMWHQAFLQLRQAVLRSGGRVVEHVVVTDPTPKLVSLITTPMWLVTGRKSFLKPLFPEAGIRTPEYNFVRSQGVRYCTFIRSHRATPPPGFLKDTSRLDANKIYTEMLGRYFFLFFARFATATSRPDTWQRRVAIAVFLCYFLVSLPLLLVIGHFAFLFARKFFQEKLVRYEGVFCCGLEV